MCYVRCNQEAGVVKNVRRFCAGGKVQPDALGVAAQHTSLARLAVVRTRKATAKLVITVSSPMNVVRLIMKLPGKLPGVIASRHGNAVLNATVRSLNDSPQ
ncbi:hypothetical protein IG631_23243 [Alternaria alternata]|nr:hypothetical protein IG631_23243 [Alternaria alternata]